jgi:high frequency lysogenization protein
MREDRVIALAGLMQALALVRAIALRGGCDPQAMQDSLASVLRIDADNAASVFGGIGGLRIGLQTLIEQLDQPRDPAITSMALTVLRLERTLAVRKDLLQTLHDEIETIAKLDPQATNSMVDLPARLAQLYVQTLSSLRPRVMVEGNQAFLNQPARQSEIRSLLLAAIRAAVLWRQLGGSQWRVLFRRRQYAMLARGLLARCTLDAG